MALPTLLGICTRFSLENPMFSSEPKTIADITAAVMVPPGRLKTQARAQPNLKQRMRPMGTKTDPARGGPSSAATCLGRAHTSAMMDNRGHLHRAATINPRSMWTQGSTS